MVATTLLEGLLGFTLAAITLRDVFDTVVVPGRTHGTLKVSRRLVFLALPVWKHVRHRGIGVNFAPAVLVGTFASWMLLLVLGFALMMHALREAFSSPLQGFTEALYVAASALATIGVGNSAAHGMAALVVVLAGFCGLAVMTMAVTYLLEVQGNIALRDTGVLKIGTTAGQPPSAIAVLERYAALDSVDELADMLRDGRSWCAAVLQSHASHPSLIYFRSARTGAGWPAALGALMDLALVLELLVDDRAGYGPAVLAREEADRLAREIVALLRLDPPPRETSAADVDTLCERLAAAGYTLRPGQDSAHFARMRAEHVRAIDALAEHLGAPNAPLLRPEQDAGTLRCR